MASQLENKIKKANLTKNEKKIAEYIMANYAEICFTTATEIANNLGLSDSTVIRFAKKLGYAGFPQLQKDAQQELEKNIIQTSNFITPAEKLLKNVPLLEESNLVKDYYNLLLKNLETVIQKNYIEKYQEISDILIQSEKKYIVGFRGCAAQAISFGTILGHILENVIINTTADSSMIESMLDINDNDCLVVMAYPRYSKMALIAKDIAQEKNARIIALTDKITSPLAQGADIVVPIDVEGLSFFNSYITPIFVVELLALFVSKRYGVKNEDRLRTLNQYISLTGLY